MRRQLEGEGERGYEGRLDRRTHRVAHSDPARDNTYRALGGGYRTNRLDLCVESEPQQQAGSHLMVGTALDLRAAGLG